MSAPAPPKPPVQLPADWKTCDLETLRVWANKLGGKSNLSWEAMIAGIQAFVDTTEPPPGFLLSSAVEEPTAYAQSVVVGSEHASAGGSGDGGDVQPPVATTFATPIMEVVPPNVELTHFELFNDLVGTCRGPKLDGAELVSCFDANCTRRHPKNPWRFPVWYKECPKGETPTSLNKLIQTYFPDVYQMFREDKEPGLTTYNYKTSSDEYKGYVSMAFQFKIQHNGKEKRRFHFISKRVLGRNAAGKLGWMPADTGLTLYGSAKKNAPATFLIYKYNTPVFLRQRENGVLLEALTPFPKTVHLARFKLHNLTPVEANLVAHVQSNIARQIEHLSMPEREKRPVLYLLNVYNNRKKHWSQHAEAMRSVQFIVAIMVAVLLDWAGAQHEGNMIMSHRLKENGGNIPNFYDQAVFVPYHYKAVFPSIKNKKGKHVLHSRYIDWVPIKFTVGPDLPGRSTKEYLKELYSDAAKSGFTI
eukprot:m.110129 g.110129  ORF g.110129 m.110129 type:complete len:474 (+) comp10707_c1_seq1:134-1555(+)